MDFFYNQIIIFFTIIISSLIGGKKGSLIASFVWCIETFIIFKLNSFNYLQIITLALSFQIGLLIAIIRDYLISAIKNNKRKTN